MKGLYDNKKDIVLKIGFQESINKEYSIANTLKNLQNFITYYCKFLCNDDIMNIIKNENLLTNYKICNNGKKPIGIIIMNYYSLGSVGNYKWNTDKFMILKNVLTQTVFAILYAYEKNGFIHGDLYINNILLKQKINNELNCGIVKLKINTYEVRIMDFEKSKMDVSIEFKFVIDNIQKLLNSVCDNDFFDIKINYKNNIIRKMKNNAMINNIKNNLITKKHYEDYAQMIDNFYIEYSK
jgi:hypothetical protein